VRYGPIVHWQFVPIAIAVWSSLAWLGNRPLPPPVLSIREVEQHFGVVSLPLKLIENAPHAEALKLWYFALAAIAVLVACGLATLLLTRSGRIAAARTLATSLAIGSASVAYVFFIRPFANTDSGAIHGWLPLLDGAALALYAGSLLMAMRFFAQYPFAIDLDAFIREEMSGPRWEKLESRFPFMFRKVGAWREVQGYDERLASSARFFTWFTRPSGLVLLVGGFAAVGAIHATLPTFGHMLATVVSVLAAIYSFWYGLGCLRYKYKRALEDDRRRIQWLYFGAWLAAWMMLGWALLVVLAPLRGIGPFSLMAFATLNSIAPVLAGLIGLLSLALSIFYAGAIDPTLTIRRTTVFSLLLGLVGAMFLAFERVVAIVAAEHLGMGPDVGLVVAGGLSAAAFFPVRRLAERTGNKLVERFTPISSLGDGPRHDAAVVFSDLSGYTALAARDERSAMVAAALFHREAKRTCERHGGRLVKTIGDAVHLEFDQPHDALAAVVELHASYPKAAAAVDVPVLGLHSGVHYGEVMAAPDGDIYGAVVNMAARLQGQARDGQIVVSQEVREASPAHAFADLGAVALKNVPGEVRLFALENPPLPWERAGERVTTD
jgi:class 3 adenylate cyclase